MDRDKGPGSLQTRFTQPTEQQRLGLSTSPKNKGRKNVGAAADPAAGIQGSCPHHRPPAGVLQAGSPAPDGRTDVSPRITTILGQQLPAVLPTIASTAAASTAVLSELVQRPPEATTAAFASATTLTRANRGLSPPPPGAATQVGGAPSAATYRRSSRCRYKAAGAAGKDRQQQMQQRYACMPPVAGGPVCLGRMSRKGHQHSSRGSRESCCCLPRAPNSSSSSGGVFLRVAAAVCPSPPQSTCTPHTALTPATGPVECCAQGHCHCQRRFPMCCCCCLPLPPPSTPPTHTQQDLLSAVRKSPACSPPSHTPTDTPTNSLVPLLLRPPPPHPHPTPHSPITHTRNPPGPPECCAQGHSQRAGRLAPAAAV